MSIAFRLGAQLTDIGVEPLLHSLLSTVAVQLEQGSWGSSFPHVMFELCRGALPAQHADAAWRELEEIRRKLGQLTPGAAIWDYSDLARESPWGNALGAGVTCLANYHVTTDGVPLLNVMLERVAALKEAGGTLEIVQVDGIAPFYYSA